MELSKTHPIPFNLFTNAKYHHVKVTKNKVTLQALTTGLGKSIQKFDILSIKEE
jgi:hypothetical protein